MTVYFLEFAVDDFAHPLDQQAVLVFGQQRVPVVAPDHLDHVPAGAAEDAFQLLDDLAVAADRPVEPLQVAIDDEDQIVEFFAAAQRDGAQRFRLVGFAVAQKRPDVRAGGVFDSAILQILD